MEQEQNGKHTKRDSETFLILGGFVDMLAIPVTIGTIWEPNFHAQVVNAIAGITLLLIGTSMLAWGFVLRARHKRESGSN